MKIVKLRVSEFVPSTSYTVLFGPEDASQIIFEQTFQFYSTFDNGNCQLWFLQNKEGDTQALTISKEASENGFHVIIN